MEQHLFNFHFGAVSAPVFPEEPLNLQQEQPKAEPYERIEKDGKTQYRCNYANCGKIFKFKSEMARHQVIHFNDRPYACPHEGCKKSFKRSDALDNHVRIHTKEMPYICETPGCGLKFTTKAGLRYHLIKHTEQKRPYECVFPSCVETFMTPVELQQHGRIVHAPKPVCNKRVLEEPISWGKKDQFDLGEGYNNEFFNPVPRPAKAVEWEVRNQDEAEKFADTKINEDYERIMKHIIQENRMLKEKLEAHNKKTNNEQETKTTKGQQFYFDTPFFNGEQNVVDENESKFLEFLRGQDTFEF